MHVSSCFLIVAEVADVLITLGEVQSSSNSVQALQSFRSALEIIYFCFGTDHYKYVNVSDSIKSLGGSVPVFKRQVASMKGNDRTYPVSLFLHTIGKEDWRKVLNSLIAHNSATRADSKETTRNPNAQLVLVAMASGLI